MRTYKVVLLGTRGAGKTTYLSSLHNKLSTQGSVGYYLRLPIDQKKLLIEIFSNLVKQWPNATELMQTDEWRFDVLVRSPESGISFKVAEIIYYDYAGGRLTQGGLGKEIDAETQEIISGADILLGLLDGQPLYEEVVLGKVDPRFWLQDVQALCEFMMDAKSKSVHFVMSKWDLFKDSDTHLSEVRNRLLDFEPFRNLVSARKSDADITRLIPVSAVGPGFVTLGPDGTMIPSRKALPRPMNVEMPFACILPDFIQSELNSLARSSEKRLETLSKTVKPSFSWLESAGAWLGKSVRSIGEDLNLDPSITKWITDAAERSARGKLQSADAINRKNQAEALSLRESVDSEMSAMKAVLDSMSNTVRELEMAYPSSRIS